MRHEVKIASIPFAAVVNNVKRAEFRALDRPYAVGDELHLREVREGGDYSGQACFRIVTHIQTGFGIPEGYGMLSIRPRTNIEKAASK